MPYGIIAGAAHTDPLTTAAQYTVCNMDMLTNGRRTFIFPDRPQDQTIVGSIKETVTYCNSFTTIHINTVPVGDTAHGMDSYSGNMDIFTVSKPHRPVGGIVKSYSLNMHITALVKL